MNPFRVLLSSVRNGRSVRGESPPQTPRFTVEQLEDRVLLSGVSGGEKELLAPLSSCQNAVSSAIEIQVESGPVAGAEVDAAAAVEMMIDPLFQIPNPLEAGETAIGNSTESEQGDRDEAATSESGGPGIVLVITAGRGGVATSELAGSDDQKSDCLGRSEQQGIIEQLTETLRAPHGPPGAGLLDALLADPGAAGLVHVEAGGRLNVTIRLNAANSSVIEVFDNDGGGVLACYALDDVGSVLLIGGDDSNDTAVIDLSTPFELSGGIHFVGGAGGYDRLTVLGSPEAAAEFSDLQDGGGALEIAGAGSDLRIAFSGLEPFVYLEGFGAVVNSGSFHYGNSPAILNAGSFTQAAGATLEIEIGGYSPGPGAPLDNGFDQINVSGAASLGGTLKISLINNFVPALGDTFDFLTFGSVAGAFSQVTGPFGFGDSNLYFEVVQQADRLRLRVAELPTGTALHTTTAATGRMESALSLLADRADQLLRDLVLGDLKIRGENVAGTGVTLDELFALSSYLNVGPTLDAYAAPLSWDRMSILILKNS